MIASHSERVWKEKRNKAVRSLSYTNLAQLDQSLQREESVGAISESNEYLSFGTVIKDKKDPNKHLITRGELEEELNALREQIHSIKRQMEHQELEQKLTYFQLIKRLLCGYQLYLCSMTIYETFKLEYNELMLRSQVEIDKPNTLELLMILYRAMPYIFTKSNCFKSLRKSILFIVAFMFISRKKELYRNIGFLISTSYSSFCAWNFKHHFRYHVFNIILNVLHICNRYIWLHGLMDYFQIEGL